MNFLRRYCGILIIGMLTVLPDLGWAETDPLILSPAGEASAMPVAVEEQKIYKVQVGNFGSYDEAQKVKEVLAAEFRGLFVSRHGEAFRVQVAAFTRQEKAKELHQKLRNKGYKVYIEAQ